MHDDPTLVEGRIRRQYRDRILANVVRAESAVRLEAWVAPGEPVPFAEAAGQAYAPFAVGTAWGRPWGTTWFHVTGEAPAEWETAPGTTELEIDLGFSRTQTGFQAEGLVYTPGGEVVKGLEPHNDRIHLDHGRARAVDFYVEAASNPDIAREWSFEPTPLGDLVRAGDAPLYVFRSARLVLRDRAMAALERDVATLLDVASVLPADSVRRASILHALERAIDILDPDDVLGSAAGAREALAAVLASGTAPSTHVVSAVGHAHIDSAWLWPLRETVRKVARTFSNVLDLMDRHRDFIFAASSAQQYAWVRERYPDLFERLRRRVQEGRFVPVGGMWVEADTNMPGGEALARQFVLGKLWWMHEFGVETNEAWLPDSFGYSGALPQIVAASATENFLTQKMSWNETNVLPHRTFWWEGIDGTRVFTHLPPVDSYNSDLSAEDLARAERQHSERGISDRSIVPYGYGDGGGGPTEEMLETARRKHDLEGSPRVSLDRPDDFFAAARSELPGAATWTGEMYLEFHRGTYTSQARTKLGNRRNEHLLREAELWATTATVRVSAHYPADELRSAWETVLLHQFHDILPGSSIAWVHAEAERHHERVSHELEGLIERAQRVLAPEGAVFNAAPVTVDAVPPLSAGTPRRVPRSVEADGDGWVLEGPDLRVRIDRDGTVSSLRRSSGRHAGREAIAPDGRGNVLQLFRDTPNQWDAWDIDRHFNRTPVAIGAEADCRRDGDDLLVSRTVGSSTVDQRISLSPDGTALDIETSVTWRERQKLLKLAFEFDVHAADAASEIQFGHVRRPTHRNTSWDAARFETVAHRWLHVDEPGFGVTVANDRVYGHDVSRSSRLGGGTTTLVRESLLRAPLYPDPHADQGTHVFRHSVSVGDVLDAVAEGYRLNLPLRGSGAGSVGPLVGIEGTDAVMIEAVKLAEDGSGDVVVRLYEARGGRADGRLSPGFAHSRVVRTDLLERPLRDQPVDPLALRLRPFELVTVRVART